MNKNETKNKYIINSNKIEIKINNGEFSQIFFEVDNVTRWFFNKISFDEDQMI